MRLDIVLPAHNEEHRIDRTLHRYRRSLPDPDVRFLVALDGCTDRTADVVRGHARDDRRVRLLEYPKLGKGGVLAEAIRRSDAPLVAFVDADGATPPEELVRLAEPVAEGAADVAIASRNLPASVCPAPRSLARRATSVGFSSAIRRLFRLPFADTQCGAKVLSRPAADRIVPLLSSRDLLFDVDLLLTARHLTFGVVEVPTIWIDQDGSRIDAVRDARRMAASALRLWIHHRVIPVEASPATGGVVIDLVEHLTVPDRSTGAAPAGADRELVEA